MSRKAEGTVQWREATATEPAGWWARITCVDHSRPWIRIKGDFPNSEAGKVRAKEAAAHYTETFRAKGIVGVPKRGCTVAETNGTTPTEAGSVNAYSKRWFADRDRRGLRSRQSDEGRYKNYVAPVIGTKAIREVTPNNLREVVQRLDETVQQDKLSWRTANKVWALTTKLFSDACGSKVTALRVREDNPAKSVKGPDRGEKKSKQWLYPSEVLALLSHELVPVRWRLLYALAVYLYLRPGELAALDWSDVNLEHGFVNVHRSLDLKIDTKSGVKPHQKRHRHFELLSKADSMKATKTGTARRVPIHPSLMPLMKALHEQAKGKGPVIELPSVDGLADTLRGHLTRAGVTRSDLHKDVATSKRVTFYDLRATGITWEVLAGTPHVSVMQRAGHEQFQTTLGYIREADAVGINAGTPFPQLPETLLREGRIVHGNRPEGIRAIHFSGLRGEDLNLRPSGYEDGWHSLMRLVGSNSLTF